MEDPPAPLSAQAHSRLTSQLGPCSSYAQSEVPAGALLYGTAYKTDALPRAVSVNVVVA